MTTGLVGAGIALASLVGGVATAPAVSAGPIVPIGPNQTYFGLVNGRHPTATIKVLCPGPVGRTGHPLAGQTVGVNPGPSSTASDVGFTGSAGRSIVVIFGGPTTSAPITFKTYGTQPIPTSLLLPCGGTAPVVFSPRPTSKTARNATVVVTYENIAA